MQYLNTFCPLLLQSDLGKAFNTAAKDLSKAASSATHAVVNPMVSTTEYQSDD